MIKILRKIAIAIFSGICASMFTGLWLLLMRAVYPSEQVNISAYIAYMAVFGFLLAVAISSLDDIFNK